jgi:hypothetical protein
MNHLRTLELEKYAVKAVTVARATVKVRFDESSLERRF